MKADKQRLVVPLWLFLFVSVTPRKAITCDFSPDMNINSGVAQARNSLLFRAFAPMLVNLG